MFANDELEEIEKRRQEWEQGPLQRSLSRFGMAEPSQKVYTPLDIKDFDFLEKVGFPGQYPYTSGVFAVQAPMMSMITSMSLSGGDEATEGAGSQFMGRAGMYSGYATAEDTRDFYKATGGFMGPNIAFDLPTQCGYDSDDPEARGEVGKVGVTVDSLRDFEIIYEAFDGMTNIDRVASNWTINGLTNVMLAMYIAIADKRGISQDCLRGTPQNDILKEYVSRGTQMFPVKPSMRMTRDTIVYCTKNIPHMNPISICGYHIREAGANAAQTIAFTLSNGIAYVQTGIDAGLAVDSFAPRFTFLGFGGSMEILREVAVQRAVRRMWARIMKERFGAKDPRSSQMRISIAQIGNYSTTAQRPINNLSRAVLGGVAGALSGGMPVVAPPYDEPLRLGWSTEAFQLLIDATRILTLEAKLGEVVDPFAGSYFMESLTDQIEDEALQIMKKIEDMGGSVAAIESGWMQREVARSAHEFQHQLETGERIIVGVNKFVDESEVPIGRSNPQGMYDPEKRAAAEEKQLAHLAELKKNRDNEVVQASLNRLKEAAADENINMVPPLVETVKTYATIGEITNSLKQVFGDYQRHTL